MSIQVETHARAAPAFTPVYGSLLQRKCACGGSPGLDGECAECRQRRLAGRSGPGVQPKLKIGRPDDRYEQEADRAAEQAVRTPAGGVLQEQSGQQPGLSPIPAGGHGSRIILDETGAPVDAGDFSSGQPLPVHLRSFFEPRFGYDFSQVRVHTGSRAAAGAESVRAQAYTVGNQIVFGEGQYQPDTGRGRQLLAHELAHVVQQRGGGWIQRQPDDESLAELHAGHAEPGENEQWECVVDNMVTGREVMHGPPDYHLPKINEACREKTGYEGPDINPAEYHLRPAEDQLAELLARIKELGELYEAVDTSVNEAEREAYLQDLYQKRQTLIEEAWKLCISLKGREECHKEPVLLLHDPELQANPAVAIPVGVYVAFFLALGAVFVAQQMKNPHLRFRLERSERALEAARPRPVPSPAPPPAIDPGRLRGEPANENVPQPPTRTVDVAPTPRVEPRPRPEERQRRRRRCTIEPVAMKFGRHVCHADFAKTFSGTRLEYQVTTPEGLSKDFDACERGTDCRRGDTLYEVKTGYDWVVNENLTEPWRSRRQSVIHHFINQSEDQLAVAAACGHPLRWYFNKKHVAEYFDSLLRVKVRYRRFNCDEDSDHTW